MSKQTVCLVLDESALKKMKADIGSKIGMSGVTAGHIKDIYDTSKKPRADIKLAKGKHNVAIDKTFLEAVNKTAIKLGYKEHGGENSAAIKLLARLIESYYEDQ